MGSVCTSSLLSILFISFHWFCLTFGTNVSLNDPLSSLFVQHVDIAALLIKYNTCVNATDKWAFTPLHEAAQKGRTQLCALLLAHGADPTMKNQEGQTALDLATVMVFLCFFCCCCCCSRP